MGKHNTRGIADDIQVTTNTISVINNICNARIHPFCLYTGMEINTAEKEVGDIDYRMGNNLSRTVSITYQGRKLPNLPKDRPSKYLGLKNTTGL